MVTGNQTSVEELSYLERMEQRDNIYREHKRKEEQFEIANGLCTNGNLVPVEEARANHVFVFDNIYKWYTFSHYSKLPVINFYRGEVQGHILIEVVRNRKGQHDTSSVKCYYCYLEELEKRKKSNRKYKKSIEQSLKWYSGTNISLSHFNNHLWKKHQKYIFWTEIRESIRLFRLDETERQRTY